MVDGFCELNATTLFRGAFWFGVVNLGGDKMIALWLLIFTLSFFGSLSWLVEWCQRTCNPACWVGPLDVKSNDYGAWIECPVCHTKHDYKTRSELKKLADANISESKR